MSRDDPAEGTTPLDPDLALLPTEERPWLGTDGAARYLPARTLVPPPWVEEKDQDAVLRQTWNRYIGLQAKEGYMALRALSGRLEGHVKRYSEYRDRLRQLIRKQRTRRDEVRRMHRVFGGSTQLEEAVGEPEADGWEHRGLAVRWKNPHVTGDDAPLDRQPLPASFQEGMTWDEALSTEDVKADHLKARYASAENQFVIAHFQLDTLEEVCRHFEVYGVAWKWDYDEIDTAGTRVDLDMPEVPWSRVFTPYTAWMARAYNEEREKGGSEAGARDAVIDRFRREFEASIRATYGRYKDPSHATIRRSVGETD